MRISSKWLPLIVLSVFFWGCPGEPEVTEEPEVIEEQEHSEASEEETPMAADPSEGSGTADASAEETEGGQENPE